MEPRCSHDRAESICIAQLTGTASRHAGLKLRADGYDQAAAIAELHSISTDPHLIAHAIGSPRHWKYRTLRALLVAAGADREEVEQIAAVVDARLQRIGFPVGEIEQSRGDSTLD